MDKIDSMLDYYSGAKAYSLFLLNQFVGDEYDGSYILDKKNYNAARVALISNILLGIKEEIVTKAPELKFETQIFADELAKSVSMIATKTDNGYVIDGYSFSDAATVVAMIRNKLAHGNFMFDLDHNRVILDFAGIGVKLNIDKLANFVIYSLKNYFRRVKMKVCEKNFVMNEKIEKNRTKPLKNSKEVKRVISNFKKVEVTLKSKDGVIISKDLADMLDEVIEAYKNTTNLKVFTLFKDMVKDKYDFDWDVRYVKFDDLDEFADSLFEVLKDQEYTEAVNTIGDKILKRVTEGKKFSEIGASFNDFILLEAAYDLQSTDKDKISNYIANKYGHFFVASNEELAAASVSLFNTLFGYLHDDLLDNENAFTSGDNTGFDYSALDFSAFNVSYLKPDNGPIDSHKETYMGASKRLAAIQSKIQKNTESLNAVTLSGNTEAQAVLSANLNNDKILEATMISDVASAKATYDDAVDYVTDNSLLVYNRGIINGIRNSIAHGKYTVIQSGSFNDVRILFEDIYEGETTFKADISIADFFNFIYSNESKVVSFVKSKKKINCASI
ncbi:MAG: hypothetical protein J6K36_02130 [Bacilli bacterium]|nr:hypothetical protein [Bacilli bacterium]